MRIYGYGLLLAFCVMITMPGMAFEKFGPVDGFSVKKTKHFDVYYHGADDQVVDGAADLSEKVWKLFNRKLTNFEDKWGTRSEPVKMKIVLIRNQGDWNKIVDSMAKQNPANAKQIKQVYSRVNSIPSNKAFIYNMTSLDNYLRNAQRHLHEDALKKVFGNFIHGMGRMMVSHYTDYKVGTPLWMTAGVGWWTEIEITGVAKTNYIDFKKYYEERTNEIVSNEVLKEDNWAAVVKYVNRNKTKRTRMARLFSLNVQDLSPISSAFMYAYMDFLLSKKNAPKFTLLLEEMIADPKANPGQIAAKTFGFKTQSEMEEAWYKYIRSSKFR